MALIHGKITVESKKLDNLIPSRIVRHRYKFNYDVTSQKLLDDGVAYTPGFPPGYDFISAIALNEFFIGDYPFNILIPSQYGSLVIFQEELDEDLRENDVLMFGSSFYKVRGAIASGNIITESDVTNITNEVILSDRNANVINVKDTGTYYVRENAYFPVSETSGITSGAIKFYHEQEKIYESLPINSYNLGELEDRSVIILSDKVELEQLARSLNPGQKVFVLNEDTYYEIIDPIAGDYSVSDSKSRLISPTRYLMKGADSGLDFLSESSQNLFDNQIDPRTAAIDDLDYSAQIFGLDKIANGQILNENFLGQTEDRNPLSESEIRTLISNSLGWCKPDSPKFDGLRVKLHDDTRVTKVDFVFDPAIANNILVEGDKGVLLEGSEWEAIFPTTSSVLTLRNIKTYEEKTVTSGARVQGVIWDSEVFANAKGNAMLSFVNSIPKRSGNVSYKFDVRKEDYDSSGHQRIKLDRWKDTQVDIELLPGYSYVLDYSGHTLPTEVPFGENTPIESATVNTASLQIKFKLKPELDSDVTEHGFWNVFGGLRFTIGKVEREIAPQTFDPEDWQGVIGSRGSQYGITVANTAIGLEKKVPYITADRTTLTLVKDEKELEKASFIEKYIGAKEFFTRSQYANVTSNLSYSNDYWIAEQETPRSASFDETSQFLFYRPTGQLIELKSNGHLLLDGEDTQRVLPTGVKIGAIAGKLAYYDPLSKELNVTRFYDPLSTFDFYDYNVEAFNPSHGFYLKKNQDVTFATLLYQDKRQVKKITSDVVDCLLLKEYPWLVQTLPNGDYYYTDLLRNKAEIISILCDRATSDGELLYTNNYVYTTKGLTLVTSESILRIAPDFRYSRFYNFLERDFQFYQVLLSDGSVKFIDKETLLEGSTNLLLLSSFKEGEDFRIYF